MRILITGASGFIGSHLFPLLELNGHQILSISRNYELHSKPHFIFGDLLQPYTYRDKVLHFRPECAIHLAWSGLPDYSLQNCRKNFNASIDLFEVLEKADCKKIFIAGTCWEYGVLTGPVSEDQDCEENSLFASFKKALYSVGKSYFVTEGSQFIWGRIFFVYGPRQRETSLIPSCIRALSAGLLPAINNPMATNDFIYVGDVADAIKKLVESDEASGIYNIGSGQSVLVSDVVNNVAVKLGMQKLYQGLPSTTLIGLEANISRIKKIGWEPAISIQTGLASTIDMWRAE